MLNLFALAGRNDGSEHGAAPGGLGEAVLRRGRKARTSDSQSIYWAGGKHRPERSRDHYVTHDEAAKIIEACPDAEWRRIIALCSYAGLRCPSEVLALRWGDILWDQDRMTVSNVKTENTTGEKFRTVPLSRNSGVSGSGVR
jgi:integrase